MKLKSYFLAFCVILLALFVISTYLMNRSPGSNEPPQKKNLHLSHKDLEDLGYYAYVLPQSYLLEKGWKEEISGPGFSHCDNGISSEWVYPFTIQYYDSQNQSELDSRQLTIEISAGTPGPPIFFHSIEATPIQLKSRWIPDRQGEYYYPDYGGIYLRFEDVFGRSIYVLTDSESTIDLDELSNMISSLEYVGESIDKIGNPWVNACDRA